MAPRYSQKTIFNIAFIRHLEYVMRHHIASENCTLRFQHCVKFSRRPLRCISGFSSSLEIAYFGLNFDDFWRKIGRNVKIKYSVPKRHILGDW